MAFLKRLGFYLIGLSIGLVFLAFFLKKKSEETGVSFCYFPNCRTLKNIRSKPLTYSDAVREQLANKHIDSTDILFLLTEGDVDFGRSDTQSKDCKTYIIEGELHGEETLLKVRNCEENAIIETITSHSSNE
ncbi:MAG: DUF4258 domain-containing protein [Maribacter sp.]|nr:DUF4258 domain-containing protein [Maribacter sp.]